MRKNKKKRRSRDLWHGRTNHALKRARERYALELSESDLARIRQTIQSGDSIPVRTFTKTRAVHDVPFMGRMVRIIYSSATQQIITFLTPEDSLDEIVFEEE